MGKKGGWMIKKVLVCVLLMSCVLFLAGCHTVKGVQQDFEEAKKVDLWLQEVLW
jgi:predicted small secreted protein